MALPFLKKFRKELEKIENVSTVFSPPARWYSTGNFALNRVLSGSYFKAVPEGRLTAMVGPSAAGKSYIICNIIREAQRAGTICLVLDSENALDPKFMSRVGINVNDENLTYAQIVTIQDCTRVLSEFFTSYEKEYGKYNTEADTPHIMVVLDSLGNCLTDSENEKFEKGVQTGDQGASAKSKKHLLRTLVSRLARCNASFVFTDQVYPADIMAGDGAWAVTNGVKYSASQIGLITKLRLKEGSDIVGIRMRIETYKSRFVKPGTKIELEVPYATGLSSISGLMERWEADGVAVKEGYSWVFECEGQQMKIRESALTEELALRVLRTNPIIQRIEREFEDFEAGDLAVSSADQEILKIEKIDVETGEIISSSEKLGDGDEEVSTTGLPTNYEYDAQ